MNPCCEKLVDIIIQVTLIAIIIALLISLQRTKLNIALIIMFIIILILLSSQLIYRQEECQYALSFRSPFELKEPHDYDEVLTETDFQIK